MLCIANTTGFDVMRSLILISFAWLCGFNVNAALPVDSWPPALNELIRQARFKEHELYFFVQAVDEDKPAIAKQGDKLGVLASTTNIPTTLAALDILGVKFRWRTQAFLRGQLQDGVLTGQLELVGGGDPSLDADSLKQLMQKLRKRGLNQINGDILINRQAFAISEKDHAQTPVPNADRVHHVRPDAFVVNQSMLSIDFEPVAATKSFRVQTSPALFGIDVINKMTGIAGPCQRHKSTLDFTLDATAHGHTLTLTGNYPSDCGARRWEISPFSPAEFSKLAVRQAWLDAGGTLTGSVQDKPLPTSRVKGGRGKTPKAFAVQESAPLLEIVEEVNKWSNNVLARHLFLSLVQGFPNRSATLKEARNSMKAWLLRQGIGEELMQLDNGSGLSREERATPAALGKLLVLAWQNEMLRKAFLSTLPIVGIDGTMGSRLKDSAAAGKAFIKTGTLTGVRSIAGYVTAASGKTYAIVALANAANAHLAQPIHDRLIEWIYLNG
jgi:serine-type D-Ala-D-Ala carboxypeptidase/endopeptidase (penicillin-binding protein 4)